MDIPLSAPASVSSLNLFRAGQAESVHVGSQLPTLSSCWGRWSIASSCACSAKSKKESLISDKRHVDISAHRTFNRRTQNPRFILAAAFGKREIATDLNLWTQRGIVMRKFSDLAVSLLLLGLMLVGTTSTAWAQNVVLNPGFESGSSPWLFYTNGAG